MRFVFEFSVKNHTIRFTSLLCFIFYLFCFSSTPALTPHPPAPAPSSSSGNKAAKSTPSVSTVSSGLKYQEMSPEVTMVEFISTSASYHGVKEMDICQLEWDILSVINNQPWRSAVRWSRIDLSLSKMSLFSGVPEQHHARQRWRLVHGQKEVLHGQRLR